MIRISDVWFEFNGARNTSKGVALLAMPARYHPAERGEQRLVPGRDGYLWMPDGSYNNTVVRVQCLTEDGADVDAINAWLSGAGDLRFSDEPTRVYKARVTKEFSRVNKLARFTAQEFTVAFDVQPFRYLYPAAADIVVTSSGSVISNPGTHDARPRVAVAGSGDVTVTLAGELMEFTGVTSGVVVDCETMDCYAADGVTLANQCAMMDDFPCLKPGVNLISWTGSITRVTITPRWRYL